MQQTISSTIEIAFRQAFTELGLDKDIPIRLVEATNPEFGDYQVNGAMAAAKSLKTNPRELATKIIDKVNLTGIAAKLEIAGPGFINITLADDYLAKFTNGLNSSLNNRFGVAYLRHTQENVVVDLSSPNLAKEMHVGHLRSTVIGDTLARIFEYMGDKVIRQNHVGDWGTQFGMLIAYMLEYGAITDEQKIVGITGEDSKNVTRAGYSIQINDLEQFYQKAKRRFDEDKDFADKAREYVVKLQKKEKDIYEYWQTFRIESLRHCKTVYEKLHIDSKLAETNTTGYVCGESFYERYLPGVITRLEQTKVKTSDNQELVLIEESDGAKCIFPAKFAAAGELPGGEETPFIVQKQDGGYLYSTTDLAALDYRVHTLNAERIVYVVDARQSFHFKQLFLIGKKAGFADANTQLEHIPFGTMMNEDGRPFKTRDGGTVKLIDLINEAVVRAKQVVAKRNPDWSQDEQNTLAELLAIGAIKYSDLSKNRNSDYIFSFDKMLAFDGNTAPYLLYAYTRIQSVLKKAREDDIIDLTTYTIQINYMVEHKLALHLAKFADTVDIASRECFPHYICQYLYNLAVLFMQFYELCPILKAEDMVQKHSRLALANKTAQILKTGLEDLLGIQVVERM